MKKILLGTLLLSFLVLGWKVPPAHAALCKVGDDVQAKWGDKWWAAKVLSVSKDGKKCKVHYKGYGTRWDEWVGAKRLRHASGTATKKTPKKGYSVGQPVKVLWGNKWWNAKVLKVKGTRYYIHYDGYGSKWDEWVGPSRIRPR